MGEPTIMEPKPDYDSSGDALRRRYHVDGGNVPYCTALSELGLPSHCAGNDCRNCRVAQAYIGYLLGRSQ